MDHFPLPSSQVKYGWYSMKQKLHGQKRGRGLYIYENEQGYNVSVTSITYKRDHGSGWDDMVL